ncbi:MAG TPA: nucleotidyltransferase family protein [Kofleriaceae bacterium]|jgi:hypothetical protein|nr:nucleotidyltransferase family protein [Kofleriaceae bacterium]
MTAGAGTAARLDTDSDAPSSIESFCWLLGPHVPGMPPSASTAQVEAIAAELLHAWQVAPVVVPAFLRWIRPEHRDGPRVALLRARARAAQVFAELQRERILELVRAFEAAGISYALLKSAALRFQIYAQPEQRCGEDIDLLVARRDLGSARRVVEGLGYEPAQWNEARRRYERADPQLRQLVEAQHHELGFSIRRERVHSLPEQTRDAVFAQLALRPWLWHLTPAGELATDMMVDVHHGLALDISGDALLATRRRAVLGGALAWVPSPAWSMFYSIYKLYWEGVHHYREGVHHYADLTRLAPTLDAGDVDELWQLLAAYNLLAAAHFVLRRLAPEFGVTLGPAIHALIDAAGAPDTRTGALDQNDYGDVWPKLWGQR